MDKPAKLASANDSLVSFQTSHGVEIVATLLRVSRYQVAFEVYSPGVVLQMSEVLSDLSIILQNRQVYTGRAVVTNLVNTGTVLVCEANLGDFWVDAELTPTEGKANLHAGFTRFVEQWQKIYKILPEYKVIVADMQAFLTDLRLWVEQIEISIRSSPSGDRVKLEQELARELGQSTTPAITFLFEKFEDAAKLIPAELQPAHCTFARRQLHPILLCAPFLYRTFSKPLGYAGDYEMVNMLARDPCEGGSLFAKLLNLWFLEQPPAEAHRNRITYLAERITEVTARAASNGKGVRILSLGCGPALEVQRLLREKAFSDRAHFTLLDFNEETLVHTETVLEGLKRTHHRTSQFTYAKKSVNLILKEGGKKIERSPEQQYDFVYCAGLFDYLSDQLCHRLSNILYEWVAPGGLLVTTNVDHSNPRRLTMDYLMEWHLIYRTGKALAALKPDLVEADAFEVRSDMTGVNIYFATRKPERT